MPRSFHFCSRGTILHWYTGLRPYFHTARRKTINTD